MPIGILLWVLSSYLRKLSKLQRQVSQVVYVRAEGPKALSPGQRPGYNGNQQGALNQRSPARSGKVKGKSLINCLEFKAFALTGRRVCAHNNPGRCPGLRASAPSGRAAAMNCSFICAALG